MKSAIWLTRFRVMGHYMKTFKLRNQILSACVAVGMTCGWSYAATYTYDELNRLKTVTYGNGQVVSYSYDAGGSLLSAAIGLPDTAPPAVTTLLPAANALSVPIGQTISAVFTEDLKASTVTMTSVSLSSPSGDVPGTVSYSSDSHTVWFVPSAPLSYNTLYTAALATAVSDTHGNNLSAPVSWSFTTASPPDTTPPAVVAHTPNSGALKVSVGGALSVSFSEEILASTVQGGTFDLTGPNGLVAGTVTTAGNSATFTPAAHLAYNTTYSARLRTGITDLAGNPLAADYVWMFSTAPDLRNMTVTLSGTGKGTITSSPSGIACSTGTSAGCSALFAEGSIVTLIPLASNSTFGGWSGACTNVTGNCSVTMNAAVTVNAAFAANPAKVKIDGVATPCYSIDQALELITAGAKVYASDGIFAENVIMTSPVATLLKGGYTDNDFTVRANGNYTVIDGSLKLRKGTLRVERVKIR